jgi:hypothetical protein
MLPSHVPPGSGTLFADLPALLTPPNATLRRPRHANDLPVRGAPIKLPPTSSRPAPRPSTCITPTPTFLSNHTHPHTSPPTPNHTPSARSARASFRTLHLLAPTPPSSPHRPVEHAQYVCASPRTPQRATPRHRARRGERGMGGGNRGVVSSVMLNAQHAQRANTRGEHRVVCCRWTYKPLTWFRIHESDPAWTPRTAMLQLAQSDCVHVRRNHSWSLD